MIGYDPVKGRLRSWVFDSEGGFGEGSWRQEGNKWLWSKDQGDRPGWQSIHIGTRHYKDRRKQIHLGKRESRAGWRGAAQPR